MFYGEGDFGMKFEKIIFLGLMGVIILIMVLLIIWLVITL